MDEKYLSYSQISMYTRCGAQYYYRYIEGIKIPPGIALIKGKSAHSGFEFNFKQKIESKIDLPKNDIVDFTINEYERAISEEEIALTSDETIDGAKDDLVGVAELYADEVAPTIQPVAVEFKHTINIPDCRPILIITDCIDDKKTVRDFKVRGKSKPQSEADNSLQLTLYSMAYQDCNGEMPGGLSLDVMTTGKKPKYAQIKTSRDVYDFAPAIRIIQAVQNGIKKEVFLPAAEGSWLCSPRWCGYWSRCKFKNKNVF